MSDRYMPFVGSRHQAPYRDQLNDPKEVESLLWGTT